MAVTSLRSQFEFSRKYLEMSYLLILTVIAIVAKSYQDELEGHHSVDRSRFLQEPALYLSRHYYPQLGDVARSLDRLNGGDVLRSLDSISGSEVLRYPEDQDEWSIQSPRNLDKLNGGEVLKSPKRNLDTLSGMSFGVSKRLDSLSGATMGQNKRELDEIDNVGFNRFAKKGHGKRNLDEIDRTGFEGFVKRSFDAYLRSGAYAKHLDERKRGIQNLRDSRNS